MSTKIIVAVETIIITLLAVTVVIYAQVVWQHFMLEKSLSSETVDESEQPIDTTGQSLTDDERLHILESLSATETTPVAEEERVLILESLSVEAEEATLTEEERLMVLDSL